MRCPETVDPHDVISGYKKFSKLKGFLSGHGRMRNYSKVTPEESISLLKFRKGGALDIETAHRVIVATCTNGLYCARLPSAGKSEVDAETFLNDGHVVLRPAPPMADNGKRVKEYTRRVGGVHDSHGNGEIRPSFFIYEGEPHNFGDGVCVVTYDDVDAVVKLTGALGYDVILVPEYGPYWSTKYAGQKKQPGDNFIQYKVFLRAKLDGVDDSRERAIQNISSTVRNRVDQELGGGS